MSQQTEQNLSLLLPNAPDIEGLRFRRYQGESDLPRMLAVINAAKAADQDERADTLEDMINNYSHLTNCDPSQDVLLAEIHGEVIAYSRVWWWEESKTNARYYVSLGFVQPAWRRKGLGRAMLHENERRLAEIAAGHPADNERQYEAFAVSNQASALALLDQEGYRPTRRFDFMIRPNFEDIPDLSLPDGLEVRPARSEHTRQIWEAFQDAFRDHWGYAEQKEEDYQGWIKSNEFQPELWQIAWDGSEVAGMILNFINHAENKEYHHLRGYTEGIAVRRPWRRRGLARALLARSLKMHRDLGMTEAALGVDTESLSGANKLYESMGFRPVRTFTTFRKPMA
jgi:GNAT superfamily N-acetyltransferase